MLAYGLESGHVVVCSIDTAGDFAVSMFERKDVLQQSKAVTQLAWRPRRRSKADEGTNRHGENESGDWQLAIASADSSLHIASLKLL